MPVTSATGESGFTLLELLVVLAILVLLAAAWPFAAPRLFGTQRLRNEAQRLMMDLQRARTLARATGAPHWIELGATHASYVSDTETHELPRGVYLRFRGLDPASNASRVTYFPDGSSTGGSFDLTYFNRTEHVVVGSMTGRAEINE